MLDEAAVRLDPPTGTPHAGIDQFHLMTFIDGGSVIVSLAEVDADVVVPEPTATTPPVRPVVTPVVPHFTG